MRMQALNVLYHSPVTPARGPPGDHRLHGGPGRARGRPGAAARAGLPAGRQRWPWTCSTTGWTPRRSVPAVRRPRVGGLHCRAAIEPGLDPLPPEWREACGLLGGSARSARAVSSIAAARLGDAALRAAGRTRPELPGPGLILRRLRPGPGRRCGRGRGMRRVAGRRMLPMRGRDRAAATAAAVPTPAGHHPASDGDLTLGVAGASTCGRLAGRSTRPDRSSPCEAGHRTMTSRSGATAYDRGKVGGRPPASNGGDI